MADFETLGEKEEHYRAALETFCERLQDDRYVLAAVLVGSLNQETIWRKESIGLWIIEADGVSKRLRSDGESERIFRTFSEDGVNIHAEIIPRSRFKRMIEGSSRTAFSHNFFAKRELVYSDDKSISKWFEDANQLATKDRDRELVAITSWIVHAHRYARKQLEIQKELNLCREVLLHAVHGLAAIEIVLRGEVFEGEVINRALEYQPDLFEEIYTNLTKGKATKAALTRALDRVESEIESNAEAWLKPILAFLRKSKRIVPLSELADHFAYSQLYPWHLESSCEWLEEKALIEKVSTPFRITTKSRTEVEEPAYFCDP
ncbi:MAG: hypothetical protein AAF517_00380 [Planctomycetota bacterium]